VLGVLLGYRIVVWVTPRLTARARPFREAPQS